ncbi:MAG: TRAP transporter small permease [Gammaproteobacteria bacterium]|nr:TRAP transporter small permease [Gammaproteobacteria bacterium]MYC25009.1 TRAP transporter small permease [Gammaproteobacteria bacterium]
MRWIESAVLVALFLSLLLVAVIQIVLRNAGELLYGLSWVAELVNMWVVWAFLQIAITNSGGLSLGLSWADEFVSMSVLWITFIGAMIAVRQNGHIRVDFMEKFLPENWSKFTKICANFSAGVVCWVVCYFSVIFVIWEFQSRNPGIGVVPSWILVSIIPIACFVMGLRFVLSIFLKSVE